MSNPTIRLEIWIGIDGAEEGHEQQLTVDDLKLLQPVIGKDRVDSLVKNWERWDS